MVGTDSEASAGKLTPAIGKLREYNNILFARRGFVRKGKESSTALRYRVRYSSYTAHTGIHVDALQDEVSVQAWKSDVPRYHACVQSKHFLWRDMSEV